MRRFHNDSCPCWQSPTRARSAPPPPSPPRAPVPPATDNDPPPAPPEQIEDPARAAAETESALPANVRARAPPRLRANAGTPASALQPVPHQSLHLPTASASFPATKLPSPRRADNAAAPAKCSAQEFLAKNKPPPRHAPNTCSPHEARRTRAPRFSPRPASRARIQQSAAQVPSARMGRSGQQPQEGESFRGADRVLRACLRQDRRASRQLLSRA